MATKDKWQAKESAQKNHDVNLLSACVYAFQRPGGREEVQFQDDFCVLASSTEKTMQSQLCYS